MAGIYIHIPFCKQACHYCDFHFSTSLKKKTELVNALAKEIVLRKNEVDETVETIYFGGGTPSLLSVNELQFLIDSVYDNFEVVDAPEITLEANPDDLDKEQVLKISQTPVNRLSIGIQSFFEEDLQLMNRAHNAKEALHCLEEATRHFDNISIDLIYGIQHMSSKRWFKNIETALAFNIPHISSYALTVEPKTALAKFIEKGVVDPVDDALAQEHFNILVSELGKNDFIHYELSNFGKEGFFSRNNSAYWLGKKYLGIGPSAHSYDGKTRSWNIANNTRYMKSIEQESLPRETETLSAKDRYNEYIMTGLRTIWGVSLDKIESDFGCAYTDKLLTSAQKFIDQDFLSISTKTLKTTPKGKFLTDGIASDLFILNLE
ncbi:radical SAM family heme chaperone HemW [Galbibacter sp. EGI 63066]|uniref:radical SAM family heme chaperone HemW n=1 Tax=Galbibacter sp. EGI 63066 TaxID=2993559 RepID=UPI0022497A22|nr:radical SAM family heme chaperone HemW [Galbibacter sp. EGI 63066]MCX2678798.1 radical SAM family heme chaperone HemW [Galbibacter sp. EGI 63066]